MFTVIMAWLVYKGKSDSELVFIAMAGDILSLVIILSAFGFIK